MRVLLVNEFVKCGGAEVQTWREIALLRERGHEAALLTFDSSVPESLVAPEYNIHIRLPLITKAINRLSPSYWYSKAIKSVLLDFSPDVVHVNGVFSVPITLFRALRDVPAIQTIRDYSAICPKGTCIHEDGSQCSGYKFGHCAIECKLNARFRFKKYTFGRVNDERAGGIDVFVCPSSALANACTSNGLSTRVLNNPYEFGERRAAGIASRSNAGKAFLYYGGINVNKGVGRLLDVWPRFADSHDGVMLRFAGRVDPEFADEFVERVAALNNVEYLGEFDHEKALELLDGAYCVVVPSLWLENYPNTVLEAMASKTLVIGSNRGGIPELIKHEQLLFDVLDDSSFIDCMARAAAMAPYEYEQIAASCFESVRQENSRERYYEGLMIAFGDAIIAHSGNGD